MPLAEFQIALGTMVAAPASSQSSRSLPPSLNLSDEDAGWLQALPDMPGFKVTCAIQQWWRETRLRDLARLTIAALGQAQATHIISAYLRSRVCTSLFFLPETLAFLQFVASQTTQPHLSSIAQFEHALLLAKEEATLQPEAPTAIYLEFAAPPEELIAALLAGQPLPQPRPERFPVWVSSALPHFWCPATVEES